MTRWARPMSRATKASTASTTLFSAMAAHLGDHVAKVAQLLVEGTDDMVGHRSSRFAR